MLDVPQVDTRADIGVIGGSGFYEFLEHVDAVPVTTPYGDPSEPPMVGTLGDRRVAFVPRHGNDHRFPAHRVNYRANIWALAALGCRVLVSPFACGSLRPQLDRGHLVIVDQLVDRTHSRDGTFFDGPETWHQPLGEPYDAELGELIAATAEGRGLTVHRGGTVVVIPGPRFSTRAESRWHRDMGWDVVNMTQAPEVALAVEAGMRVVGIGLVTDFDVGLEDDPSVGEASQAEIFAFVRDNAAHVRELLAAAVPLLPPGRG